MSESISLSLRNLFEHTIRFIIKNEAGDEAVWFVDMKKHGRVGKGRPPIKPDVTIWCSDHDFVALASGEVCSAHLYMPRNYLIMRRALKRFRLIIPHDWDYRLTPRSFTLLGGSRFGETWTERSKLNISSLMNAKRFY